MLCEVDTDFLLDDSNYNGLKPWEKHDYNWDVKEPTKQIDAYMRHIFKSAVELL